LHLNQKVKKGKNCIAPKHARELQPLDPIVIFGEAVLHLGCIAINLIDDSKNRLESRSNERVSVAEYPKTNSDMMSITSTMQRTLSAMAKRGHLYLCAILTTWQQIQIVGIGSAYLSIIGL